MASLKLDEDTAKVLSSDTRKEILELLNERNMTVTELSRKLGLSKSTVHEHLSKLVETGFINKLNEEGRKWVYYELTEKGRDLVGNKVKKVLVFTSAALTGILGTQQFLSHIRTGAEEEMDMGPMAEGIPETAGTITEALDTNIHLLVSVLLFVATAAILLYYHKKMK